MFPSLGFMSGPTVEDGVKVVVIDAGHGGRDPGNLGTGRYAAKEKDIALEVSLKVGKYIEENLKDVEVIYTRKTDSYPELWQRTQQANAQQADLFISIHCDAFTKSSAKGCQSIVMGLGHQQDLRIAKNENAVILLEEDHETKYQGFDPNQPQSIIGMGISQDKYLNRSISLAAKIQDQFRTRVNRVDRGVKQQPLWVTSQVFMPSVLVELGFLTNPSEEDFLNSTAGKEYMASAIYRAFKEYKKEVERDLGVLSADDDDEIEEEPSKIEVLPIDEEEKPEELIEEEAVSKETPKKAEDNKVVSDNKKPVKDLLDKLKGSKDEGFNETTVWIGVQIMSTSLDVDLTEPAFSRLKEDIYIMQHDGLNKVVYGRAYSEKEALSLKSKAKSAGFKDCFLVGYRGNTKISYGEAKQLLK